MIKHRDLTTSHAAIGASNSIQTLNFNYKAQANTFIDHYANISRMKRLQSDRPIIRRRLFYPVDHTLLSTKHQTRQ